ncbi:MAG: geranylgeranylglyceryl/heptaprenylglyceryl phosphate synthase [Cytophagales bacterium]|nr:geranylgeranylglyceryl/heptaprenylglyceryl phosphate synthase [Bernardetiaceae bacterium]MDW8211291.1 geranylgeranylglyceryl/heptaprenylglyceryl phosphate synthase [Cytophagales bacterium]
MSKQLIEQKINKGEKLLAVLVDPDKVTLDIEAPAWQLVTRHAPDLFLVGGSLLVRGNVHETVLWLKKHFSLPVWLFPGNYLHLTPAADALLLLSLLSGRNPEFLIGQHVVAAPIIRQMQLPAIPTAYLLIEGHASTTVAYISNTQPIPGNKIDIAVATAMAAELLGFQMLYLEAGSGANLPVPTEMISAVRQAVQLPLIVGGGIRSAEILREIYQAGASIAVIGTAWEENPSIIEAMITTKNKFNAAL